MSLSIKSLHTVRQLNMLDSPTRGSIDLIKVYFSVQYSACVFYQLFHC